MAAYVTLSRARKSNDEARFVRCLYRELDTIFKLCVPKKTVFIAIDGPGFVFSLSAYPSASKAKLVTQRLRRLKIGKDKQKAKQKRSTFDFLQLTPGTEFMQRLKQWVAHFACSRLQNDRKFSRVVFDVSGADMPGEGEVKANGCATCLIFAR